MRTFSTLAVLLVCTALFAFACRSDRSQPTLKEKIPVHTASMDATPSLSLITGLDNSRFLYNASGTEGYYYVEAKAVQAVSRSSKRTPLNLSIVIDHSGSMAGGKLSYAKQAAKHVVDQLTSEDYVSIVIYDTDVHVVSTSNKVGDKSVLKNRIDQIQTGGSTNLHGGMMEGYTQVKSTYQSGYVNRVLLLSDGLANVGITSVDELQRIAKSKNLNEGITISTFGVGIDFNEDLMTGLAENGSGNYYFINNPEQITSIFEKELKGLLNVVAQNAELNIMLPPGIIVQKVFGYPYELIGNRLIVHLRDVVSGETKAILVKFSTFGNEPKFHFNTRLTYADALADQQIRVLEAYDVLTQTASIEEMGRSFNPSVKSQVVLFESNDRLETAMRAVDAGQYEQARAIVRDNDSYLNSNLEYVQQSAELQTQMSANTSYQTQIMNVEALRAEDLKLLQKESKVSNYYVRKKR